MDHFVEDRPLQRFDRLAGVRRIWIRFGDCVHEQVAQRRIDADLIHAPSLAVEHSDRISVGAVFACVGPVDQADCRRRSIVENRSILLRIGKIALFPEGLQNTQIGDNQRIEARDHPPINSRVSVCRFRSKPSHENAPARRATEGRRGCTVPPVVPFLRASRNVYRQRRVELPC